MILKIYKLDMIDPNRASQPTHIPKGALFISVEIKIRATLTLRSLSLQG